MGDKKMIFVQQFKRRKEYMFDKRIMSVLFILIVAVSVAAVPSAPSGFAAANEGTQGNPIVHISWTATDLNQTCFSGYRIEKSSDNSAFSQIKSEDTNTVTSYDDTSIAPGQYLEYRMRIVADEGANDVEDCGAEGAGTGAATSVIVVNLTGSTTDVTNEFINLFWVAINTIRKFIGLLIALAVIGFGIAALVKLTRSYKFG